MQSGQYVIFHMRLENGKLQPQERVGSFEIIDDGLGEHYIPALEESGVTLSKIMRLYGNTPYYSIIRR